ncbi:hypothetical protein RB195_015160 [Necator americanus]|uniref:Uncharacterized protein n=1 Tax=Necator americanus TaxID=51031 RepID=A0ABR1E3U3_NECAM
MSDVSNSYSAWETLPEDELPLGIAVRRPVLPPRHYDGGKPLWNYIIVLNILISDGWLSNKIDMEVDIGVQDEVKLVISWSFRMKDKSVFDQNVIKNVHILQYRKKKAAQHYDVVVITEDKTLRKIDAGVSIGTEWVEKTISMRRVRGGFEVQQTRPSNTAAGSR